MAQGHIFMCILHCIMALAQLMLQFLEALYNDLEKVLRAGVKSVFHGAPTKIRLESIAPLDGKEWYRLRAS